MAGIAELSIFIRAKDEFSRVAKQAQGAFDQAAKSAQHWGGAMQVAVGIGLAQAPQALGNMISGFTDAAQAGAQLELQAKKASTVFGDQIGVVKQWASENAAAMGLTKNQLTNAAAAFQDLLIPMGFTREQATGMTTDVMGLSGALAEWSGGKYDAAAVSEILAKAMLGERDQLKALGISISEADVQQRLLEKGQADLTGQALAQAKAVATQELIFEKSTDAQAAWANGAGTAARQAAELKAKQAELAEEMQARSVPVMAKLTEGFMALPEPMQMVAFGGKGVLDALAPMAPAFMALGPAVSGLLPMLGSLSAALMTPPLGIIVLLAAAGVAIYLFRDQIKDGLGKAWEFIKGVFGDIQELIGGTTDWLKDHWEIIVQTALAILFPPGAGLFFIITHFDEITNWVKLLISGLKDFLAQHWQTIVQVALAVLFPPGAGLFFIVTHWTEVKERVLGIAREMADSLLGGVALLTAGIVNAFAQWPGKIGDALLSLPSVLFDAGKAAIQGFINGLKSIPLPDLTPGFDVPGVPFLQAGTPYVPRNMLAYLHQGEMVLPAHVAERVRAGAGETNFNITINAGGGADPYAISEAVQDGLHRALRLRGAIV